jgi:hypothetical protein
LATSLGLVRGVLVSRDFCATLGDIESRTRDYLCGRTYAFCEKFPGLTCDGSPLCASCTHLTGKKIINERNAIGSRKKVCVCVCV